MKLEIIVAAANILNSAKINKLSASDRVKMVKIYQALKKESEDFNSLLDEAQKRLKPDGFDGLNNKSQQGTISEAEKKEYDKKLYEYQQLVNQVVQDEVTKDIEITFDKLNEDGFYTLIESNGDLTLSQINLLQQVIVGK